MMYLNLTSPKKHTQSNPISNAHKPIKETERKKGVSGTFSGSQLPERIYYMGNPIVA